MSKISKAVSRRYLLALTGLPTASGCEGRVVDWVCDWASRHRHVQVRRDGYGNLMLSCRAVGRGRKVGPAVVFTAHMDHPAFVVTRVVDSHSVESEFRGGVSDACFKLDTPLLLYHGEEPAQRGRLVRFHAVSDPPGRWSPKPQFKCVFVRFDRPVSADVGDILTWRLPGPFVRDGLLHAPACDDLAGVAAAISAFEVLVGMSDLKADVRVLLTRAEEVGFLGAIGACRSGIIPKRSLLVTLENSRSYKDSPIGGGPIVRVGDMLSTFDTDTTWRIGQVASELSRRKRTFQWQRKLMPGGACEATTFTTYGYRATGLCLALGNYHNMKTDRRTDRFVEGRVSSEVISMSDYHHLVELLVALGTRLPDPAISPGLRGRLDELFACRESILR